MYIVGLTGGIGSGKSTIAELFAKKGISIIDTDIITRDLTQPGLPALQKIIEHFSPEILDQDGLLNRTKLRKIIFDLPDEKKWLEELLHPLVRIEMKRQAANATSPYCIVVIPLLFETKKNPFINRILVIDASMDMQLQRTQQRDQQEKHSIQAIIDAQVTRKNRLTLADDVIDNSGKMDALAGQVEKMHQLYLSLANKISDNL